MHVRMFKHKIQSCSSTGLSLQLSHNNPQWTYKWKVTFQNYIKFLIKIKKQQLSIKEPNEGNLEF